MHHHLMSSKFHFPNFDLNMATKRREWKDKRIFTFHSSEIRIEKIAVLEMIFPCFQKMIEMIQRLIVYLNKSFEC